NQLDRTGRKPLVKAGEPLPKGSDRGVAIDLVRKDPQAAFLVGEAGAEEAQVGFDEILPRLVEQAEMGAPGQRIEQGNSGLTKVETDIGADVPRPDHSPAPPIAPGHV